jgi:hypothetical protein
MDVKKFNTNHKGNASMKYSAEWLKESWKFSSRYQQENIKMIDCTHVLTSLEFSQGRERESKKKENKKEKEDEEEERRRRRKKEKEKEGRK